MLGTALRPDAKQQLASLLVAASVLLLSSSDASRWLASSRACPNSDFFLGKNQPIVSDTDAGPVDTGGLLFRIDV